MLWNHDRHLLVLNGVINQSRSKRILSLTEPTFRKSTWTVDSCSDWCTKKKTSKNHLFYSQLKTLVFLYAFEESASCALLHLFAMIQTSRIFALVSTPHSGGKQGIDRQIFIGNWFQVTSASSVPIHIIYNSVVQLHLTYGPFYKMAGDFQ